MQPLPAASLKEMGCTQTNMKNTQQHFVARGALSHRFFKMITEIVLVLVLCGCTEAQSSSFKDNCMKETYQNTPTLCSNYLYVDDVNTTQRYLRSVFDTLRGHLTDFMRTLEESHDNLKQQLDTKFTDIEADLDGHKSELQSLENKVRDLKRHKESVEEKNITAMEQRLGESERKLQQEARNLNKLETETKEAFKDTEKILEMFKKEISDVNTTASELANRADSRVNAAKQELDGKLTQTQRTAEGLATRLDEQKEKSEEFMNKTEVRFEKLDQQLETQSNAVTNQRAEIYSLSSRVDEITSQGSTQVSDLRQLQSEVDSLTAAANATVAFSASITESDDVFTGPGADWRKILKFNKVFTNIGNAYCSSTGRFTAPVKGVYHFSFMTFGYNSHTSGAMLVVNGEYRVGTFEFKGTDTSDTTSSSVILELNPDDHVLVALWDGGKVHEAVFSGFLISPLS